MKGRRLDDSADETSFFKLFGRSGLQEKLEGEVTSYGFSQMKLNSSIRYGASLFFEASSEATKVISRVSSLIRSFSVGHDEGAEVCEVGL